MDVCDEKEEATEVKESGGAPGPRPPLGVLLVDVKKKGREKGDEQPPHNDDDDDEERENIMNPAPHPPGPPPPAPSAPAGVHPPPAPPAPAVTTTRSKRSCTTAEAREKHAKKVGPKVFTEGIIKKRPRPRGGGSTPAGGGGGGGAGAGASHALLAEPTRSHQHKKKARRDSPSGGGRGEQLLHPRSASPVFQRQQQPRSTPREGHHHHYHQQQQQQRRHHHHQLHHYEDATYDGGEQPVGKVHYRFVGERARDKAVAAAARDTSAQVPLVIRVERGDIGPVVHPQDMIGRVILLKNNKETSTTAEGAHGYLRAAAAAADAAGAAERKAGGRVELPEEVAAAHNWRLCSVRQWEPSTGLHWVTPLVASSSSVDGAVKLSAAAAAAAEDEELVDLTVAGGDCFKFYDRKPSSIGGGGAGGGGGGGGGGVGAIDRRRIGDTVATDVTGAIQQLDHPTNKTQQPQEQPLLKWLESKKATRAAAPQAWVEDEEEKAPGAFGYKAIRGGGRDSPTGLRRACGGELEAFFESLPDCVQMRAQRDASSFDLFIMVGAGGRWGQGGGRRVNFFLKSILGKSNHESSTLFLRG